MGGRQQETKLIGVRSELSEDLYDKLAAEAKANERSLAAEIRVAVKAHLLKVAA